jgi:hypothetical protein
MSIAAPGLSPQPPTNPAATAASPAAGSSASATSGLVFSGGFATYNGQPIALSDIFDDQSGRFTQAQQSQANQTLQAREKAAYGQYVGTNTQAGNKQFVVAYINYVKSLPPDEQNSQRYRGTLTSAENLLNEINTGRTGAPTGTTQSDSSQESPVLRILRGNKTALQDGLKSSQSSTSAPTDVIDLSPAAQAYLSKSATVATPGSK